MATHVTDGRRLWVEFLSLSSRPVVAERSGERVWFPTISAVEFQSVPDAPSAGNSPVQRLSQMRASARSFSAWVHDQDSGRQQLRLLPQPVLRYADSTLGVVDGGVFVFARSTNPEMLLLVELQHRDGVLRWVYSAARFTGREGGLNLGEQTLWHHERLPVIRDPKEPFFQTFLIDGDARAKRELP